MKVNSLKALLVLQVEHEVGSVEQHRTIRVLLNGHGVHHHGLAPNHRAVAMHLVKRDACIARRVESEI